MSRITTSTADAKRSAATGRRFVSIRESAEIAAVHRKTVARWVHTGRLTAYKVGDRVVRIDVDELLALFEPMGRPVD